MVDGIHIEDFFIGAVVTVFGRQLQVSQFADEATKRKFDAEREQYALSVCCCDVDG